MLTNHSSLIYRNSNLLEVNDNDFVNFNNMIFKNNQVSVEDNNICIDFSMSLEVNLHGLKFKVPYSVIANLERERCERLHEKDIQFTTIGRGNVYVYYLIVPSNYIIL